MPNEQLLCGPNSSCCLEHDKSIIFPIKLDIHFSNVLSISDERPLIFHYFNFGDKGVKV